MKTTAVAPAALRPGGPSPDPLPSPAASSWQRHAPWVAAAAGLAVAHAVLEKPELGVLACGAGVMAWLMTCAQGRLRASLQVAHFAGGLTSLTILRSPADAGAFLLPAGVLVVAALLARAAALRVRPAVAPLAGRLPWRFASSYRGLGLRFGGAGLLASVALVAAAPYAELKIVGVAMLPLALRTFIGTMLSRTNARAVWCAAITPAVAAWALLVPGAGAVAAAWTLVLTETLLFAGAALMVLRRTGVSPLPRFQLAILAATLLFLAVMVPTTGDWPLLLGVALGLAAAPFLKRALGHQG